MPTAPTPEYDKPTDIRYDDKLSDGMGEVFDPEAGIDMKRVIRKV